jgi:hypothetical protein
MAKKSQEAKELTAAALLVLAQRMEAKVRKMHAAVDSLKEKARALVGRGKKKAK